MFHEYLHLLLKLGLDLLLAESAPVGRGLGDATSHQGVPLCGHLVRQATGGDTDLATLAPHTANVRTTSSWARRQAAIQIWRH